MAIANLNGVDLYYETSGHGERVVLTHGAWGDARSWDAVAGPLAKDFEVVRWDRRGHSRSGDGEGPGSYQQDAEDLAALIEHLGPEPVHVYGNSSGGTVTLTLMVRRPDLLASAAVHEPAVDQLVARPTDGPVADMMADMDRTIATVNDLIQAGDDAGGARTFVEMAMGPGSWERLSVELRDAWTANAPAWLDESGHERTVDVGVLASSDVPLMITHATESPAFEIAYTTALIERVPNASVKVLEGTGHVPYRTHPGLWLATVHSFLLNVSGRVADPIA